MSTLVGDGEIEFAVVIEVGNGESLRSPFDRVVHGGLEGATVAEKNADIAEHVNAVMDDEQVELAIFN